MFTNKKKIPLSVALFLATDNYDYSSDPNEISVTTLIKSTRQVILGNRAKKLVEDGSVGVGDVCDFVPSRLGTAIHEGIERAWLNPRQGLLALGKTEEMINAVVINPSDDEDLTDKVPIYLERRTKKEIDGVIVSGAFDFCGDGTLRDTKTTGTFMYTKQKSDGKYIRQGSIYRWLNPDIITDDVMHIDFIFKDWNANKAISSDKYPQSAVQDYPLTMMSYEDTELYIKAKLSALVKFKEVDEVDLPHCSDEDLWMEQSEYKYYTVPGAKRATKVFGTDAAGAYHHKSTKGVGEVREIKAEPKACKWCEAVSCSQRDGYIQSGILKM